MKVSVLGCGRWGSFIAWYLHRIHHDVMLYGRVGSAHLQQFRETRSNGMVTFDESVQFTDSLEEAVLHGEILVISIAAQNLRSLMASLGQTSTQRWQPTQWSGTRTGLRASLSKRMA